MYRDTGGRDAHPPPLDDGDDVVDLDVEFVRLLKVLQSTHVYGHGLKKTQELRRDHPEQITVVCKSTRWRNTPN